MHIGPTRKLGDEKLGDNSPTSPTSPSFRPGRFRPGPHSSPLKHTANYLLIPKAFAQVEYIQAIEIVIKSQL